MLPRWRFEIICHSTNNEWQIRGGDHFKPFAFLIVRPLHYLNNLSRSSFPSDFNMPSSVGISSLISFFFLQLSLFMLRHEQIRWNLQNVRRKRKKLWIKVKANNDKIKYDFGINRSQSLENNCDKLLVSHRFLINRYYLTSRKSKVKVC